MGSFYMLTLAPGPEGTSTMTFQIGLLGGSFDPPHIVHLLVAQYVLATTPVDEVWLVPAMQNPLKDREPVSFEHRLIMCERMVEGVEGIEVCRIEQGMGPGPHCAIETLNALQERHEFEFSWIIGSDILPEIHKWHRISELVQKATFIILSRAGHHLGPLASSKPWAQHFRHRLLDVTFPDVSSTKIREQIAHSSNDTDHATEDRLASWVHKDVLNHIRLHRIYEDEKT